MRVLFSTTAGTGHFGPLIPVAEVCARAGHEVAVAAPSSFHESVGQAGFAHLPGAEPPLELMREVFSRIEGLSRPMAIGSCSARSSPASTLRLYCR